MTGVLPLLVAGTAMTLAWPLGRYLAWAMAPAQPGRWRSRYEAVVACLLGPAATTSQAWPAYCGSMLTFSAVMFGLVFLLLMLQHLLPLNPDGHGPLSWDLALNTAASFTSNTNLQHYSGEASMSYLTQLAGLMWLQFVSAATGLAALAALCRGLSGKPELGNFYQDLARATGLVLLPLAALWAVFYALQGVPMTFHGAAAATTLEGGAQTIARGPVACFLAIKQLGTNGGGFFGPNCAHPFEGPTWAANLGSNVAIVLLPMAAVWMFGRITGRMRDANVVFGVMLCLYATMLLGAIRSETARSPALAALPVAASPNLEGKELRFGLAAGPTWAVSTTATANGSVNAMHDSLNPLTGLYPMIGMWLNVAFGGVGVGFINMFLYIVTAVFIAGMMVGRSPAYFGRKIEAREMKLAMVALLVHPLFILGGTALFALTGWGAATVHNPGSHGLSEILYEFSSAAANNGSGFEGLGDNTVAWNVATGVIMLLARFIPILAPLAIAGSLAAKQPTPDSAGTFRTDTTTFGLLLLATVLLVGALLFLPVAVLGPVAEHLGVG